jgi:hypothetical protein
LGDEMKKITSLIKAILTLIGYNILIMLIYGIVYMICKRVDISYLVAYIIMIIILFIVNHDNLIEDFVNIKNDYKNKIVNVILFTFIFAILVIISNKFLYNILGSIADTESTSRSLFLNYPVIMFITIGILAPIFEELTARYPYRNININKNIKLFIYSTIFALMHIKSIDNLIYIIPYMFLSLEFSYAYYKTNNIYGSIIVHMINNIISLLILL